MLHLTTRMAVPPTFGGVQEYKLENELFSAYLKGIQLFFLENGVEDDKKVLVFLNVVGSKTYSLLHNLVTPTLPQDSCSVGGHIEEPLQTKASNHH